MRAEIVPSANNRILASRLRAAGPKQRKEYNTALRKAAKPMSAAVSADLGHYMPRRGGYLGVLAGSLVVRVLPRAGGVVIRAFASGRTRRRDVRSLERGRLRHPLYGRWATKSGKPTGYNTARPEGFFTKPITARADLAVAGLIKAMRAVAGYATRG
jgi:hypothetical protein